MSNIRLLYLSYSNFFLNFSLFTTQKYAHYTHICKETIEYF